MKILITGATGFVGSELAKKLIQKGYEIYGLVRKDSFSKNVPEGLNVVFGDVTILKTLKSAVNKTKPEIVIHLAAKTSVRFSFQNPIDYAKVNYLGTINLIEAVKNTKIKQFIYASTTETYKPKNGLIKESDPLFGSTPYGISKASADFYVQMAGKAFDLPFTILRPCNTFGRTFNLPEEARGYLVEKAIIQMLTQEKAEFDGFPHPKRCWMHVEDHVSGYLAVLDKDEAIKQIFNVSSNNAKSVGEVVSLIARLTRFEGEIKWGLKPRPYDPPSLCPDGSKLMKLGWKPKYTLEEGLEKTIKYWRGIL